MRRPAAREGVTLDGCRPYFYPRGRPADADGGWPSRLTSVQPSRGGRHKHTVGVSVDRHVVRWPGRAGAFAVKLPVADLTDSHRAAASSRAGLGFRCRRHIGGAIRVTHEACLASPMPDRPTGRPVALWQGWQGSQGWQAAGPRGPRRVLALGADEALARHAVRVPSAQSGRAGLMSAPLQRTAVQSLLLSCFRGAARPARRGAEDTTKS